MLQQNLNSRIVEEQRIIKVENYFWSILYSCVPYYHDADYMNVYVNFVGFELSCNEMLQLII